MNLAAIRRDFPILKRKVNGKRLVYFDNAATTQKPRCVIEATKYFYENCNSNIHRAIHTLGEKATEDFESARKNIASFINAAPEEIAFTKNTTESINLVAHSLGKKIKAGDEILLSVMEHHSNIVPWQFIGKAKIKYADIDKNGVLEPDQFNDLITKKTKIISITQASNVLGSINDVKEIARISHDNGVVCVFDAAQSVPHMPVNVKKIHADFIAFSGHKMLGPTGIGVLYGKKEKLENLAPFLGGGDMIREVSLKKTTFADAPAKFEAGTPNIAGAVGLSAAVDYLRKIGMENVKKHEAKLAKYAVQNLDIQGLKIYGPEKPTDRTGIVSFTMDDIHPHDIATILDKEGIAIRSGHNCAMPLMQRLGCNSIARASFYIYNEKQEIIDLAEALEKAKRIFSGGKTWSKSTRTI